MPVFTTVVNGDELVLTPASAAPARVGGVSRNAGTEPWSPEDWRAFFHERAGIAEYDGGLSRSEAEDHAFACSVSEWLNRNPVTSPPGRCVACREREYGYDPLLPYGVEPTGHAWLHSRCWEAWHAARKGRPPRHSRQWGLGSRLQRNERRAGAWGGGSRIKFEINPVDPMDHSRAPRLQTPRCGARTPTGTPCQRRAIRGRKRCRLHGGLSPGAPRGQKNGNFKTGNWTIEAIEERKWLRSLVRSFAKPTRTE